MQKGTLQITNYLQSAFYIFLPYREFINTLGKKIISTLSPSTTEGTDRAVSDITAHQ